MRPRALLGVLCLAAAAPPSVSGQWEHEAEVRRTLEAWRASWIVPGAAVAVICDGEVLLLEGFGVRRLGSLEPVNAGTLFELGSASKTFTATTAALAVEDGLLAWATPLVDLLPDLRLSDGWIERRVTLLDALTHRTGYGRHDLLWLGGATTDEVLARLRHVPPSTGFREEFSYSNLMYMVAGEALAAAFARPWEEVVAGRIFEPLGMGSSRVGERAHGTDIAVPHVQLGDSTLPASTPPTHAGPAGALLASAADLVPWMRFHIEAEGAVRELQEPRIRLPLGAFGPQYARAARLDYGSGWFVSDYAGRRMVDHIGGHGGMVANVTLLPDDGIGVAVLTNHGDNLLPVAVTYRILDLLLGLDPRPWNDILRGFWAGVREARAGQASAPGGDVRQEGAPPSLPVAELAGSYDSPVYGLVQVEEDGKGLVLHYGSNLTGRLSHRHHDTFSVAWTDPMIRAILGPGFAQFHLDMAGRPSGITVTGFQGERIEASRIPRATDDRPLSRP